MTLTKNIRMMAPANRWENNNSYATGYIPQGIISIDGEMMHSVSIAYDGINNYVTFDPNVCSLDKFGDPVRCTRKQPIEYKLTIISHQDGPAPHGMTHHLYELAGTDYKGPHLFVMQTGPDPIALPTIFYRGTLMFVGDDGTISTILQMHHYIPPG